MSASRLVVNQSPLYGSLKEHNLEIRLLHLEGNPEEESPIRCRLMTYSLVSLMAEQQNVRETFEALSYTWGDQSGTKQITINNTGIHITSNLEAFLRQRREPDKDAVLWVDALCINQNDAMEKNYQVPMMTMIYSCASRLTVWLGPAADGSHLAIKQLISLGAYSPYDKMPILQQDALEAIRCLFQRPWWRRVWIIQEIAMGGLAQKLNLVRVHCGPDSISWIHLVVAAARMRAHNDDSKQHFPDVTTILELDSLRESSGLHLADATTLKSCFDLLCRFRHFLASNPRDKIYALYNMFSIGRSEKISTRYDAKVEDVYTEFATATISAFEDLEILRHCCATGLNVPSWVPDWSKPLTCEPLPVRRLQRYFDVPWWLEPIRGEHDEPMSEDGTVASSPVEFCVVPSRIGTREAERQRQIRLKRLELETLGRGIVKSFEEIPSDFSIHNISVDMKSQLKKLMSRNNFILMVGDDRCSHQNRIGSNHKQPHPIRQGEIVTEQRMKRWILQELSDAGSETPYHTMPPKRHNVKINSHERSLRITGIPWDEVEVCHEPFVDDIEQDWTNATRFMVAVGCCKALATGNTAAKGRYPTMEQRLEAFWSTLLVGQKERPRYLQNNVESRKRYRYMDWLPEVPRSWVATSPPVTVMTAGRLALAEQMEIMRELAKELGEDSSGGRYEITSSSGLNGFLPEEWSEDDVAQHRAQVETIASMWDRQPYDLHHRPFDLFSVVPDPFWEMRRREEGLAKPPMHNNENFFISTYEPPVGGSTARGDSDELLCQVRKRLNERLGMILPRDTLDPGMEKYALGRRFFITKKGYFGLGPRDTNPGDRIVALFGSPVPYILRKRNVNLGQQGWTLVGETYVHGIMSGEIMKQWEYGLVEAGGILLY